MAKNNSTVNTPTCKNWGTIYAQSAGCRWLSRSAFAKVRRLISMEDLVAIFKREGVPEVQIKAMGGRFVLIIFPDMEIRDNIIPKKWLLNWVEEIKQWNGEQASEEWFAWISCFGMPINAWSYQTFKDIDCKLGHFIQLDESTRRN